MLLPKPELKALLKGIISSITVITVQSQTRAIPFHDFKALEKPDRSECLISILRSYNKKILRQSSRKRAILLTKLLKNSLSGLQVSELLI